MSKEIKEILDELESLFEISEAPEHIINGFNKLKDYITNLQQEIDRLNNIINELEKWIGQEWYCFDNESIEFEVARDILDKLKELKEEK